VHSALFVDGLPPGAPRTSDLEPYSRFRMEQGRLSMRTLADLIKYSARYYPDTLSTIYKDTRLTYRELNRRADMLANGLLKEGVGKGDRVGIICHTSHFFQEIFFGIVKSGGVAVTVNWRLSPRETEFVLNDADVSVLFIAERFWGNIDAILSRLPKIRRIIVIGNDVHGAVGYEAFLRASSDNEASVDLAPEDPVWLLYTSGTTGKPKGVLLTHRSILADAEHNIIGNRLNRDNVVWLHALPMFHIAGKLIFTAAYVHGTMVFMDRFDLKELCETIEKERCSYLLGAPQMWQWIMDYPELDKYDLSSLRFGTYSTAPMPMVTIKRLKEKFPDITFFSTYGLTEAGSSLTILPADQHITEGPDHLRKRLGSLGRPMYGVDVRILDDNGRDCPPGVVGEIVGRGDNIMKGYWNLPEETSNTVRDGWLFTGDMGYWDEYGYIYMTDRKKDLIISGGENIAPKEVENVIREIEGVVDVAVIGVPDDKWGEIVKAVVIKGPDSELSEDDVIRYCAENIASYKKPRSVVFTSAFPRSPVGKVLKKDLRVKYGNKEVSD